MKLVILICLVLSLALSDSCGGNCPSGKCPSCPCGTSKSMQDIASWCSKYNWNQACCKCVVSHESGGNANAVNYNTNGTFDAGLWQINKVNWGCSGGSAPCNPNTNLQCAIKVYQASGSWKPWSTARGCGC